MAKIITFPKEITFRKMKDTSILCNMDIPLLRGTLFEKNIEVKVDETNTELLNDFKKLKGVRKIMVLVQGPLGMDRYLKNAKIVGIADREKLKENISYLL